MTTTADYLRMLSHHEAGHAVLGILNGWDVRAVQIDPTSLSGGVHPGRMLRGDADIITAKLQLSLGGPLAGARFEDELFQRERTGALKHITMLSRPQNSGDMESVLRLAEMLQIRDDEQTGDPLTGKTFLEQLQIAEAAVYARWPAIQQVAALLMTCEALSGSNVRRILASSKRQTRGPGCSSIFAFTPVKAGMEF